MDVRVAGDEAPLALLERDWYQRMLAEDDPRQLLRLHARSVRVILRRVTPMYVALRQAAGADADLATDYWRDARSRRYETQRAVTDELARRRALCPGVTARAAAEALVLVRGWKPSRFERWPADTLVATLLPPDQLSP
ncbi:MAG: hypothetical protein ACRDZ9_00620 [Acidimicrobiales bacterium]